MLVPGIVGPYGLLVGSFLVVFLVIRRKWRNAVAKKEEIMRLVAMASDEAAMAEVEATSLYASVPLPPRPFQCAICYFPTTMRCSQCKAVRYCSGKCQIIHWRRGHKDECQSSIAMQFEERSDFSGGADSQYSNDFEIENESSILVIGDDAKVKPCGDGSSNSSGISDRSKKPLLDGSSPDLLETMASINETGVQFECQPSIVTVPFEERRDFGGEVKSRYSNNFEIENKSKNLVIDYDAKVKPYGNGLSNGSGPSDRSKRPLLSGSAPDLLGTVASINETRVRILPTKECARLVEPVDSISCSNKLKNLEPSHSDEKIKSTSQFIKAKTVKPDDVQSVNLGSKKVAKGTGPAEKLTTDAAKPRNSSSNDGRDSSRLFDCKENRSFSDSASGDQPSSTIGGHFASTSKSAKSDGYHALPAKIGSSASLAQNGLKTSMRKVVQQFRASKQLKGNMTGHENEIAGRYKVIFPYELFIKLFSNEKMVLWPFGLTNCGNSCYANAVLQCLAFTRPLTSYFLQGLHSKTCRKEEWCFICEFEHLILKAREGKSPLSPIRILSKIHKIGGHLGHGREEDAHEFLRYAVDTMQSVFLDEAGAKGPSAEETTLVGMTFGGYLGSKIKCLKCLGKSERCEQMMDLTVEIDGEIGTLEEALAQFTASEVLDRDNKYYCCRCKSYQKAKKKLTVLEAPNILTIVLKRFQSGNFEKLNKSVRFPEVLNMASYMNVTSDKSAVYNLYAVVVHLDIMNATFSGHYVCYVKNIQGKWFKIDDSTVESVELERVLLERAYMLFYARHSPRPPALRGSNMAPLVGKLKRRNLEAVPSSLSKPKSKSSTDSSALQQKLSRHSYSMTMNGPAGDSSLDPYDWRLNSMYKVPFADSSSSESSSLLSSSDASSCSNVSSKDSASTDDFTDYIFGEVGTNWYSRYGHSNFNSDLKGENDAWRRLQHRESISCSREDLEGEGSLSILYTDPSKSRRKSTSYIERCSSRENDLEQDFWGNPFDVKYGVPFRR
ncbi:ubiquitin carboxyl-terminal hydrolase 17 isoform X1 [Ziziphus jujuba]|uniref:ubiquitinyl hydrolase 1 n=2 Tax=Ziziphus jujuba TaxID=326968 RepID=A0A6P4AWS8_ZIZJJ|nr:ubiquitin carboxyl-terminal hydrolase 17 isoform X1 [Ziziphus jujuba]